MSNQKRTAEEQKHYESLINLFKFSLTLFSVFGLAIGFLIYSNGKEMRDELREQRNELKDNVKEMKLELSESEKKMKMQVESLISKTNTEIDNTKSGAINEIANVKNSATEIAKKEAQNSVNKVLNDNNFDAFVTDVAKKRMEPQINTLVDTKIEDSKRQQMEVAIKNISSNERNKVMVGLSTIESNPNEKLNEQQLSQLVDVDNKNEDLKERVALILLYRKSETSLQFFKKKLLQIDYYLPDEIHGIQKIGTQYFIMNIEGDNFYMEYLLEYLKKVEKNNMSHQFFLDNVSLAIPLNPNYIVLLFNNKKIIDYIFNFYSKNEYIGLKKYIENALTEDKKVINKEVLKSTYLFSK